MPAGGSAKQNPYLGVFEGDAKDVRQEEDGRVLGCDREVSGSDSNTEAIERTVIALGGRDVDVNAVKLLDRAFGSPRVLSSRIGQI